MAKKKNGKKKANGSNGTGTRTRRDPAFDPPTVAEGITYLGYNNPMQKFYDVVTIPIAASTAFAQLELNDVAEGTGQTLRLGRFTLQDDLFINILAYQGTLGDSILSRGRVILVECLTDNNPLQLIDSTFDVEPTTAMVDPNLYGQFRVLYDRVINFAIAKPNVNLAVRVRVGSKARYDASGAVVPANRRLVMLFAGADINFLFRSRLLFRDLN